MPLTVCRVTESTRFLVVEMGARGIGPHPLPHRDRPADDRRRAQRGRRPHRRVRLPRGHRPGEGRARPGAARRTGSRSSTSTTTVVASHGRPHPRPGRPGRPRRGGRRPGESTSGSTPPARASFTLAAGRARRTCPRPPRGATTSATPSPSRRSPSSAGSAPTDVAAALAAARPASRWRMEVTEREDGVTVVNDAYNANPDSMRAALGALASMSAGTPVLGGPRDDARARGRSPTRSTAASGGPRPRPVSTGCSSSGRPPGPSPTGPARRRVRAGPWWTGSPMPSRRRPAASTSSPRATSCCSSPAVTPGYGCSGTA